MFADFDVIVVGAGHAGQQSDHDPRRQQSGDEPYCIT